MIRPSTLLHLWRWRAVYAVGAVLAGAATGEAVARFGLGLGDPPLMIRDEACGYRFAPNQSVTRFGNHVSYDARSVRGSSAAVDADAPGVLRVLAIGDSVLNGGALADDADTVTGVLNQLGVRRDDRRLQFLNLSAGSWAPPAQLGYLRVYGTLNADVVVLVLNTEDARGGMAGAEPPFPTHRPWSALEELVMRYIMGRRRHLLADTGGWAIRSYELPAAVRAADDPTAVSGWCLGQVFELCRTAGVPVAVVLWPSREECEDGQWGVSIETMRRSCIDHAVPIVDCLERNGLVKPAPGALYFDNIHPAPRGRRILAGALLEAVDAALEQGSAPPSDDAR